MAEVKFNIFATSGSILASRLNLCIQYNISSWTAMPVNNNICKYTVILEEKFLGANHGHCRYRESDLQEIEYRKEYHMYILSIWAHLVEQFLHCLKI